MCGHKCKESGFIVLVFGRPVVSVSNIKTRILLIDHKGLSPCLFYVYRIIKISFSFSILFTNNFYKFQSYVGARLLFHVF